MRQKLFFCRLVYSMTLACSASAWAGNVTGTWSWEGNDHAGGWLKTIQSGSKIHFQLELARGGPSYNSGFMAGEFELKKQYGRYRPPDSNCEITFTFRKFSAVLAQNGDDCGFGMNVFAIGTFPLRSKKTPKMSHGDPRFN
jgi:hypothetical protein